MASSFDQSITRRLLFAREQLPRDTPKYWEIVSGFGFKGSRSIPSADEVRVAVENLEYIDREAVVSDRQLLLEFRFQKIFQGGYLGVVLISSNENCKLCGAKLLVRCDQPSFLTLYTNEGTVPATHFRKYCRLSRNGCQFTQHYGFYSIGTPSEVIYDTDWDDLAYFISSNKTGFELKLLKQFNAELLIGQISYKQKSEIYNNIYGYEKIKKHCRKKKIDQGDQSDDSESDDEGNERVTFDERVSLDRRRLEEGHLRYCILDVFQRYPNSFSSNTLKRDIQETLESVAPTYYKAYAEKYASHHCSYPGCRVALVIDGNMKNRRNVCAASKAGYIQYEGLSGSITTGCQLTPLSTSRYCYYHAPRFVSTPQDKPQHSVVTGKRETRAGIYYQVANLETEQKPKWLSSSSVETDLIQEYESGLADAITDTKFGMIKHTIVPPSDTSIPSSKRVKKTNSAIDKGIFADHPTDSVSCNTEKDKDGPLHHRTAGILAGVWPCGIITILAELFTSESKSQVYAILHEYFQANATASRHLKFLCYDDGCHLRRYARCDKRRNESSTSAFLASIEIVIDKMHMAGHTDKWCQSTCDPHLFSELDNVDTEICEQSFSWLSRYARMTRRMGRNVFVFFLLYICDLHNAREIQKLQKSGFILKS